MFVALTFKRHDCSVGRFVCHFHLVICSPQYSRKQECRRCRKYYGVKIQEFFLMIVRAAGQRLLTVGAPSFYTNDSSLIGRDLILGPPASAMALTKAAIVIGTASSPTLCGEPSLGSRFISISGT